MTGTLIELSAVEACDTTQGFRSSPTVAPVDHAIAPGFQKRFVVVV